MGATHTLKVWISDALEDVEITLCASDTADGTGEITVTAYANAGVTDVDTNVTINFTWQGASAANISGQITIFSGTACASSIYGTADVGEPVSTFTLDSISGTSTTQNYTNGGTSTSGLCTSC
jgi:hypothetical protein